MENTSKALILAGEILIGILVLTLIAVAIISFGRFSANMNAKMSEKEIAMFNSNFENYSGRIDITSQEIATIINYAKKENDNRELVLNDSSEYYINVTIGTYANTAKNILNDYIKSSKIYTDETLFKNAINSFISQYNTSYFSCNAKITKLDEEKKKINIEKNENDIMINEDTKMVYSIHFNLVQSSFNITTKKDYTVE